MVVKASPLSYTDQFCFNDTMYTISDHLDNHTTQNDNVASATSINRQSPSLDNDSNGYYSASPPAGLYHRSGSQSSLSGTMSPPDYAELRSPRQENHFFGSSNSMFEQSLSPSTSYPSQSFGIFGSQANIQQICTSGPLMINNSLEIKSPTLEIKQSIQPSPFYSEEQLPTIHNQLPSPNSQRSNAPPVNIPNMPTFSGYRPYQQVGEMFTPGKQEFYMQTPFYNGYPNYW